MGYKRDIDLVALMEMQKVELKVLHSVELLGSSVVGKMVVSKVLPMD
jgi:hypothetical protein